MTINLAGDALSGGTRNGGEFLPSSALWIAPPLLVLAGCFFYPLSLIVGQAFTGEDGSFSLATIEAVFASVQFHDAVLHTIGIALAASAGCLILGFILAFIIAFFPFPGSALLARLIDTFIALPTFLAALAFTFLYGSAGILNMTLMAALKLSLPPVDFLYSAWGVILAEVTVYTPFIMRPLLAAFSLIETSQIEVAASLGAGFWRIVRQIILPAALPALLAGGSLCLLLTVNEFGIVLFIGAKGVITLPLLVYDKAIQEFDYAAACVIALVNILLSLGLYSLYRFALGRFGGHRAGLV
jgi:2-aminoethylphosphonate transport system permease protein